MVSFTQGRLQELIGGFRGKRIAVVGDLMLDRYYWGSVARISPEAPVPVVEVESESARLGGAANVANNIASLGGVPLMIGVVGEDTAGKELRAIIEESNLPTEGVLVDPSRPTTVKTRVIAHHQHVVRVDKEVKGEIGEATQGKILDVLKRNLNSLDAIIIEDYNKGVVGKELIRELVALARKSRKIITADPKFNNFFEYKHVTVFKPNRMETEEALGLRLRDQQSVEQAGRILVDRLGAQSVLLTLGDRGMSLFESDGTITHVSTAARKVSDVSGAGDTVIAVFTAALAAGAEAEEAARLANFAGGIVVMKRGTATVSREELAAAIGS